MGEPATKGYRIWNGIILAVLLSALNGGCIAYKYYEAKPHYLAWQDKAHWWQGEIKAGRLTMNDAGLDPELTQLRKNSAWFWYEGSPLFRFILYWPIPLLPALFFGLGCAQSSAPLARGALRMLVMSTSRQRHPSPNRYPAHRPSISRMLKRHDELRGRRGK